MTQQEFNLMERIAKALERIAISSEINGNKLESINDNLDRIAFCADLIKDSHFFYSALDNPDTISVGEMIVNNLEKCADGLGSIQGVLDNIDVTLSEK